MNFTINDIEQVLNEHLNITHISIIDNSYLHAHHTAMQNHTTSNPTHLKIHIISSNFNGKRSLECHRMVNKLLESYFKKGLHAVSLKLDGSDL